MCYPNGDVYRGEWANDKMHGKGSYIYASGTIIFMSKLFSYQRFLNPKESRTHLPSTRLSTSIYFFVIGDIYSGCFEDGMKQGNGTYLFKKDGSRLIGIFNGNLVTSAKWVWENSDNSTTLGMTFSPNNFLNVPQESWTHSPSTHSSTHRLWF